MERSVMRVSPENFITVSLLSAAGYLGIVGMQKLLAYIKAKAPSNG